MKKFTIVIPMLVILCFTGCGKENSESRKNEQKTETVQKDTEREETAEEKATRENTDAIFSSEIPDDDLVVISDYIPDIIVDLKYASKDNFTGEIIYEESEAYLRYGTVKKLSEVQEKLRKKGMGLLVWDAYRPTRAQFKLWEICPDPTYVSDPKSGFSNHSRGNTVDITVVTSDGKEIEMPSGFDEFTDKADRDYSDVTKKAAENSAMLEKIMTEYGFTGYSGEWWHYSDNDVYPVVE